MPLPKVVAPTFELNLISSQKAVKYRPFLVKEEKALLIAMENGNDKDITATIKNVLKGCMMSRVKIDDLPSFDLEYLFLNVRGKSVGETVDLIVTCQDDGETTVPLTIGLSDIKLHIPDGHSDTVDIGGGISIKMKYPSMQQFLENNFISPPDETNQDRIDKAFESVAGCIDQVFTEEEAWSASDCTKKELVAFIESLNSQQFGKIENFFTTMPRLQYKSTVKNPKTDVESEVLVEGLSNFFA
ncbi:MAG: baseplate protein [Euryarchaeota archaeon]|nr:baseplate protein [Euryarchaeota archaeon]